MVELHWGRVCACNLLVSAIVPPHKITESKKFFVLYLADPGKARGCSIKSLVIN